MSALKVLDREAGLRRIVVSTYQAVSGAGSSGVDELAEQVAKLGDQAAALAFSGSTAADLPATVFPAPIAFNVVPMAGTFVDDETNEEHKLRDESAQDPRTAGPARRRHLRARRRVHRTLAGDQRRVRASRSLPNGRAQLIADAPGVELVDVPTPHQAAGSDPCYVGRVRRDESVDNGLAFFVSGDNLRKGAALNAVEIAEVLLSRTGTA